MKIFNKKIEHETKGFFDFIDITDSVKNFVKESQIKDGLVNIQLLHTSAGLILNENEPLLLEDFKDNLEKTATKGEKYKHDNLEERRVNVCKDECINGHSHCKAIHLPSIITLNLIKSELQLGQWQSILLIELDRKRKREVQVQIIGL